MPEDRRNDRLNVLHGSHVSLVHDGAGLGRENQILGGPRSGTPLGPLLDKGNGFWFLGSRRPHQFHRVSDDVGRGRYFSHEILDLEDLLCVNHLFKDRLIRTRGGGDDLHLLIQRGIVDLDIKHESIELGLWQRIGSLLFDGVLGCEDEEGKIEVCG